jgi:hypothetical protein
MRCICGNQLEWTKASELALDYLPDSLERHELAKWAAAVARLTDGRGTAFVWACYGCGLWTRTGARLTR